MRNAKSTTYYARVAWLATASNYKGDCRSKAVSPQQASNLLAEGNVMLIDIRTRVSLCKVNKATIGCYCHAVISISK